MSLKRSLARELAMALLAGPPDHQPALQRCARVLGENPSWLRYLVRNLRTRFKTAWHAGSLPEMTTAILGAPLYEYAWLCSPKPRLCRPVLATPSMAPLPWPLADCTVPNLTCVADVADWLELPLTKLEALTGQGWRSDLGEDDPRDPYRYRWLEKPTGGRRLLEIPRPRLREVQRRIHSDLLAYVPPHEAAMGFRRGHSCLGNASRHLGQEVVLRFDLQDFFLTVGGARVNGLFRTLGYGETTARLLTRLCTHAVPGRVLGGSGPSLEGGAGDWLLRKRYVTPHLPQGAPTSPVLANLCTFRLDLRLNGLAEHLGGRYTRYADDLVISGGRELAGALARVVPLVGAIVEEEGFHLNHHKTRVMRRGGQQRVTGIVVNQHPNLARAEYDVLKATLHNCVIQGPDTQNRGAHPDFRAHLLGRIAHVAHLNPARAARLAALFEQIDWKT